jgi:hypothetical protein
MRDRDPNRGLLLRMLAGLAAAVTIVTASLGYALSNSQAFL